MSERVCASYRVYNTAVSAASRTLIMNTSHNRRFRLFVCVLGYHLMRREKKKTKRIKLFLQLKEGLQEEKN